MPIADQDSALLVPAQMRHCSSARQQGSWHSPAFCNTAGLPVTEAITLLKKAAASKKIAKQQVMEAIDVLEKAKLEVRAAEQLL